MKIFSRIHFLIGDLYLKAFWVIAFSYLNVTGTNISEFLFLYSFTALFLVIITLGRSLALYQFVYGVKGVKFFNAYFRRLLIPLNFSGIVLVLVGVLYFGRESYFDEAAYSLYFIAFLTARFIIEFLRVNRLDGDLNIFFIFMAIFLIIFSVPVYFYLKIGIFEFSIIFFLSVFLSLNLLNWSSIKTNIIQQNADAKYSPSSFLMLVFFLIIFLSRNIEKILILSLDSSDIQMYLLAFLYLSYVGGVVSQVLNVLLPILFSMINEEGVIRELSNKIIMGGIGLLLIYILMLYPVFYFFHSVLDIRLALVEFLGVYINSYIAIVIQLVSPILNLKNSQIRLKIYAALLALSSGLFFVGCWESFGYTVIYWYPAVYNVSFLLLISLGFKIKSYVH